MTKSGKNNGILKLPFTGRITLNYIIPRALPWAVESIGLSARCYPQALPNGNALDSHNALLTLFFFHPGRRAITITTRRNNEATMGNQQRFQRRETITFARRETNNVCKGGLKAQWIPPDFVIASPKNLHQIV